MNFNHEQQAELLDQYTAALRRDPNALPPRELAPEFVMLAQQLHRQTTHVEPDSVFARQLGQQVRAEAAKLQRQAPASSRRPTTRFSSPFGRWLSLGSIAAVAVIVALVAAQFLMVQPRPANAAEILQKAQTAAKTPTIRSFVLTETLQSMGNPAQGNGGFRNVTKRWFEAPNRWRIESTYTSAMPGKGEETHTSIQVSDGTNRWDYDPQQNTVTVERIDARQDGQNGLTAFGATELESLLQEASGCRTPTLQTDATVAGRKAYVVALSESTCGSNSAAELNGRQVLWIDQQTFFVLKAELYAPNSDHPIATREISDVQFNTEIDAQQFGFTPPANVTVQDLRQQ